MLLYLGNKPGYHAKLIQSKGLFKVKERGWVSCKRYCPSRVRFVVSGGYYENDTDEEGLDEPEVAQWLANWAIDSSKAFHNGEMSFNDVLTGVLQAAEMSQRQPSSRTRAAVKAAGNEKLEIGDIRRSARIMTDWQLTTCLSCDRVTR